jgi:CRISPR-associated endonuclease/helicase Cas3
VKAQFDRLLAKSCPNLKQIPQAAVLCQHLTDVHNAAQAVLGATGNDQLRAVGLSPAAWSGRLRRVVLFAAALHDLGKANDHFQEAVRRQRSQAQGLRHEWVSYWLLETTCLREWVSTAFEESVDLQIMLWAISGHHPRDDRPTPPRQVEGGGSKLVVLLGHQDYRDALAWIGAEFGLDPPPNLKNASLDLAGPGPENAITTIKKSFLRHKAAWEELDVSQRLFAAACKACLLGADVAGSAVVRGIHTVAQKAEWIGASLEACPDPADLEGLVRARLRGQTERPFQTQVAERQGRVLLVRAGCGMGKTAAAYLRAARRWPGKRVWFCYPTTGTATEGFRGYLFDHEQRRSKHGARLFHSRAATDLEMILHAVGDEDSSDELLRNEALQAWSTPIVSCTVDTVLAVLQNQRRALFAWPALAQSAFVFDEIHAYDQKLFGGLLRFLDALRGVPILLMTASLPAARREAIVACLARSGECLTEVMGPPEIENLPRYHRLDVPDPAEAVREELAKGGKVLWVCNTVIRAMNAAAALAEWKPLLYHSRFRYEDRVARHSELVSAFEVERKEPALGVCTQVAEMSLDLSATMLVMDLAPVPALIQRLGRLNRWAMPPEAGECGPPTRPFLVVEPLDNRGSVLTSPYDPDLYGDWPAVSRRWIVALGDNAISQTHLADAWQTLDTGEAEVPAASPWLDGGPETRVDSTRDASPGITVILDGNDSQDVQAGRKMAAQVAVPMPQPPARLRWREWSRIKGVPVVPASSINYDPKRGASWREN